MAKLRLLILVIFFYLTPVGAAVFVVGDIHGDIQALKRILVGFNLIDADGKWIGKDHTLVTMGDLVDRGPNVREVLDLLMGLESQAKADGGKVHNLLGNHEFLALQGIMDYAHMNDQYAFQEFKGGIRAAKSEGYRNAFKGETVYAKWFASRKAIVIIDDTLYVHAGLDENSLKYSVEEINKFISDWVLYLQEKGSKPSAETEWLVGSKGPLWTRKLSYEMDSIKKLVNPNLLSEEILDQVLKHFGVKRIVIGHSLVTDFRNTVNHPVFGDKVISTDTGINEIDKLMVTGFKVENGIVEGYWFDRYTQNLKANVRSYSKTKKMCLKNY